jgi:hypothetical protein
MPSRRYLLLNVARAQILDQINAKKPAKLLNSKSLTICFSRQQIWAVFFRDTAKCQCDDHRIQADLWFLIFIPFSTSGDDSPGVRLMEIEQ